MPMAQCIDAYRRLAMKYGYEPNSDPNPKPMKNVCAGGVAGIFYLTNVRTKSIIVHEHNHNYAYT